MLDLSHLSLFIVASLVILLIPGPAVLYIATQSVNQGRLAATAAVLGLEFGTVFHVVAATFGVSAFISSSAIGFSILKYLGAAYLVYLGVRKLLPSQTPQDSKREKRESLKHIFWQGAMVELFNPKTMLFFFAFLPQFVNHAHGNVALQMLMLGFLFLGLATCTDLFYALLLGSVRNLFRHSNWLTRKQHYVESSVYVSLSVITALSSVKG